MKFPTIEMPTPVAVVGASAILACVVSLAACEKSPPTVEEAKQALAQAEAQTKVHKSGSKENPLPDPSNSSALYVGAYYCIDDHEYKLIDYHAGFVTVYNTNPGRQDYPMQCSS